MGIPVAIIGAGNGGAAFAAHMTLCGEEVRLTDLFPEVLKDIKKTGTILLKYREVTRSVKPYLVTENVAEALCRAKLIMVITPAFTHRMIAKACASLFEDGQVIVLNPGRTAGALEFLRVLRANGCDKQVVVAETQTLVYSCRRSDQEGAVEVYGVKSQVDISAIPGDKMPQVLKLLRNSYPQFKAVNSTLTTGLANIGCVFHPAPILLNTGRVETGKENFLYYKEGISPSVAKVAESIDEERMAVAAAYGVKVPSAFDWLNDSYDVTGDTLYERIQSNEAYRDIIAPRTVNARYLTDDMPNGLVPISELGKAAGVQTPVINAVITLANTMFGRDFSKEGRTLRSLGLEGANKEKIYQYFKTGY